MMASQPIPDAPVFAALITPHRSLGQQGVSLVLGLLALLSIAASIPFFVLGAWPVVGFFGLDLLALYAAFHVNMKRAKAFEQVSLTPIELLLRKVSHKGQMREWRFNPFWTKIEKREDEDFGLLELAFVSRAMRVTFADQLSSPERESLNSALQAALNAVRR